MSQRVFVRRLYLAIFALALGCAPQVRTHASRLSPDALRQAQQTVSYSQNQHSDLRFVYWGPQGRLRGRADVWLQTPDKWRYTIYGGHGGAVFVLVCDGQQIMGLDLSQARYVVGQARAEHIDRWLPNMALHLEPAAWVNLWQGRYQIPPQATFVAETATHKPQAQWQQDAETFVHAELDGQTGQVQNIAWQDPTGRTLRRIAFSNWDKDNLPRHTQICILDAQGDKHQIQLSVTQRDSPKDLSQTMFTLTAPQGIATELLP